MGPNRTRPNNRSSRTHPERLTKSHPAAKYLEPRHNATTPGVNGHDAPRYRTLHCYLCECYVRSCKSFRIHGDAHAHMTSVRTLISVASHRVLLSGVRSAAARSVSAPCRHSLFRYPMHRLLPPSDHRSPSESKDGLENRCSAQRGDTSNAGNTLPLGPAGLGARPHRSREPRVLVPQTCRSGKRHAAARARDVVSTRVVRFGGERHAEEKSKAACTNSHAGMHADLRDVAPFVSHSTMFMRKPHRSRCERAHRTTLPNAPTPEKGDEQKPRIEDSGDVQDVTKDVLHMRHHSEGRSAHMCARQSKHTHTHISSGRADSSSLVERCGTSRRSGQACSQWRFGTWADLKSDPLSRRTSGSNEFDNRRETEDTEQERLKEWWR